MSDFIYKLQPADEQLGEEQVRSIVGSMQRTQRERQVVAGGEIRSQNFETGVAGWQIDAEGNAEFNDGTFRGRFDIGGTTITIDNTEDIQENLDVIEAAGGGTLYLQNGTYTLTADITIPNGVTLEGVSRDGVIIDCDSTYKVSILGSNSYTTGTIAINDGDDEVVGTGTTFTSGMVGRYIMLSGLWYEITAFTDTTHIDISPAYSGSNLTGYATVIADVNFAATLRKVTITNATGAGLKCQYTQEVWLDDIIIFTCGTGVDFDDSVFPRIFLSAVENGVNLDMNNVWGWKVDFSEFSNATTGAGVALNNCGNATFFDSLCKDNTTDGLSVTSCSDIAFISVGFEGNGSQGIEFVSGNVDCQLTNVNAENNTSDGIKLTATTDRVQIIGCSVTDNGGYGINIAAATCDNNVIVAPAYDNNSSGTYQDLGTGTIIIAQASESVFSTVLATKDSSDASTTQNIAHDLGTTPKKVKIWAQPNANTTSRAQAMTSYNGTTQTSLSWCGSGSFNRTADFRLNHASAAGTNAQVGVVTWDSTNIIITWTKTDFPTGTYDLFVEAEA
jgi:hypothetical protein